MHMRAANARVGVIEAPVIAFRPWRDAEQVGDRAATGGVRHRKQGFSTESREKDKATEFKENNA